MHWEFCWILLSLIKWRSVLCPTQMGLALFIGFCKTQKFCPSNFVSKMGWNLRGQFVTQVHAPRNTNIFLKSICHSLSSKRSVTCQLSQKVSNFSHCHWLWKYLFKHLVTKKALSTPFGTSKFKNCQFGHFIPLCLN